MTPEERERLRAMFDEALTDVAASGLAGHPVGIMIGVYFCQGLQHQVAVRTWAIRPHDPRQVQEDVLKVANRMPAVEAIDTTTAH